MGISPGRRNGKAASIRSILMPDPIVCVILMKATPLTFIIEQAREVLIWGRLLNWMGLSRYTLVSTAIVWAGYATFQKTRKWFADVL
jgi:lipopolysaccharide transport system permease protein